MENIKINITNRKLDLEKYFLKNEQKYNNEKILVQGKYELKEHLETNEQLDNNCKIILLKRLLEH